MPISRSCLNGLCRHCTGCSHDCHNPDQPPLFGEDGLAEGEAGKAEGIARVDAAANAEFKILANKAIDHLINLDDEFLIDDVWSLLHRWYPHAETSNPKVMGALINAAARQGRIKRVGYAKTTRPEAHARPVAVWRKA